MSTPCIILNSGNGIAGKPYFTTFIVLLLHLTSLGQPSTIYNYSIAEGLPSSEVYEIHQDRNGFLWFATDNGIAKYDGSEFEIFHLNEGLTDPVVFGFFEDKKGRIWCRTYSGKLAYYYNGKIEAFPYNNIIKTQFKPYSQVRSIFIDNEDVWMAGKNFFGKITPDGVLKEFPNPQGGLSIRSIQQNFMLAHYYTPTISTLSINNKIFSIQLKEETIYDHSLHTLELGGKLFISINKDIFQYNGRSLKKVFTGSHFIISLSRDNSGNIWVGYLNHGTERFTENFTQSVYLPFLNQNSITSVLEDSEGGLWFSTLENGVYRIPNIFIKNLILDIPAKIRGVKMHKEKILLGDQFGDIHSIDLVTRKREVIKSTGNSILSIFQDSNKNYWVGSSLNTYFLNEDFMEKKVFYNESSASFSQDIKGNVWSHGGNRLRQFSATGELLQNIHINVIYRSLFIDDSLFYLTGRSGLYMRGNNLNRIKPPNSFEDFKIINITSLNDSLFILSTLGSGFILLNKISWEHSRFDSHNNFIANNIYATLKSDSILFMGTEKGLIKISIKSLLKNQPSFQIISNRNGLIGEKINFLEKTSGSILAFTDEGISIIPEYVFDQLKNRPVFYLKKITINNQPQDSSYLKILPYDQNNIQLSFGYISFNNNKNINSRFRLADEKPWTYPTTRTIDLYALSQGSYSLDLQFSWDNVNWTYGIKNLQFVIKPPWWKLWYFQFSALVLIFLFVFIYFRSRVALAKQRQHYLETVTETQQKLLQTEVQTRERERSRIAKDLHDTIGTNLVALKMIVSQLLHKHHEPLVENVENQLQSIIHETKEIIYDLAPPGVERYGLFMLLKNLIDKIKTSTSAAISLHTYGEDLKNTQQNIIVLRILQELLSNSIKHSMAKSILIEVNAFEDRLNIIYEDDGVGFSYENLKPGMGLRNITSRIESLKGQLKFESGDFGISYDIDIPFPK